MHGSEHPVGGVGDLIRHPHWRWALVGASVLSLVLGTWGYHHYLPGAHTKASWSNAVYHTTQLFFFHAPHFERPVPLPLEVARWLAPMTTLFGLFGLGRRIFREEASRWGLRRSHGHTIVCGLGRKGMELVRHLRSLKEPVVVIEKNPLPDLVAVCEKLGALVLSGDATRVETLKEARVEHAAQLFAVCPEDAVNCEIAAQARHLRPAASAERLACHVHLGDVDLREALQQAMATHSDGGGVDLHFFDVTDPEARRLVTQNLPLDHDGVGPDDPRAVHLIILGFGRMGRTLALRAAQLGCLANGKRLRISVIDRRAETHRDELLFRHPQIGQVADLQFYQQEAASPQTRQILEAACAQPDTLTSFAVCFDNDALALELALQMMPFLQGSPARLAVRLGGENGLAHLLAEARGQSGRLAPMHLFGMEEHWCQVAASTGDAGEVFARRIHAEYERLTGTAPPEGAGLNAGPRDRAELERWLKQPEDFRESCRQQAAHLYLKLRAIGCEIVPASDPRPAVADFPASQLEMLARWEHDRWVTERLVANWRYASGKKDAARRTNPNLVPWERLDAKTQEWDRGFVRLIPKLLEGVGLKACRRGASA